MQRRKNDDPPYSRSVSCPPRTALFGGLQVRSLRDHFVTWLFGFIVPQFFLSKTYAMDRALQIDAPAADDDVA